MDLSKKRKADENGSMYPIPADVSAAAPPSNLSAEDADKILENLSKEQLVPILRSALLRYPDVLEAVRSVADADTAQRKLFIRGLGWETTTESLRSAFSAYGVIDEAIVITDKATGKSKGYGFVTFRHIDGAILALREPNKKIDGRITVTQLAAAGNSGNSHSADVAARKIYVGNIPFEISSERLLEHFSMYGEIEEGPLGFDKQTGKAKGFAFFVYKTEQGARASLVDPMKTIDGHQVVCKFATDNKKGKQPNAGMPSDDRVGVSTMQAGSNYGGYAGYQGGSQQQPGMGHPNMTGPAGPGGYGNQGAGFPPGGYGHGVGVQYGSGPGAGVGAGEYGSGLSNAAGYRMPPSSMGMPSSGGYPDSGNYGVQSGYASQGPQPGVGLRVPPGGMYQGMPPYY